MIAQCLRITTALNLSSNNSPSYKTAETVFENINQTVLALTDAVQIYSLSLFADRLALTVISHFTTDLADHTVVSLTHKTVRIWNCLFNLVTKSGHTPNFHH